MQRDARDPFDNLQWRKPQWDVPGHEQTPDVPYAEVADATDDSAVEKEEASPQRKVLVPGVLFLFTCASTYLVGSMFFGPAGGLAFAAALMATLTAHEFGHFLQAQRYGVPASLPYFLPMPISPIGTMGAVIAMQPGSGDRKSLFDIAITGPLAGVVPAIAFSLIGLAWSEPVALAGVEGQAGLRLGAPLLFRGMRLWIVGALPEGYELMLHPLAYAGWVGIFITALNLIPISQLDGGHILYSLLRERARPVATMLLGLAIAAVLFWGYWGWTLMILLLLLIGPAHPPTANDSVPLGTGRYLLGWLSLLFVLVGFTPTPFVMPG